MIKSNMNQLGNAKNHYQTDVKRVLTVCSAGLLRSPTIAGVLHMMYGYNVRACGANPEYALVPIITALIHWADMIIFADQEHYDDVKEYIASDKPYAILELPDRFPYRSPELIEIIEEKLINILGLPE